MKRFYVDLHLEIKAEDIDDARAGAEELANEILFNTDGVESSRVGEVEECEDETSEEE